MLSTGWVNWSLALPSASIVASTDCPFINWLSAQVIISFPFIHRTTWFCVGYSSIWGKPISARIKELRDKYNLTWLRTSMSYHKFSNLGERFNSDLTGKVMDGIVDFDLRDRKCGCQAQSKLADGRCFYDDNCRRSMVVYELKCKCCDMSYIGKTQDYLRTRTQRHFYDVWKVIETGRAKYGNNWYGSGGYKACDAFAKHFADHCRDCPNSNAVRAKLKDIVEPTILWQGDRIRCMKSSRTLQCKICMVERK